MARHERKPPRGVTCTMGELLAAIPAFRELMGLKLPAQRSYHIAKLSRLVNIELAHFQEQRDALIKELGQAEELTEQEKKAGMAPYNRVKPEHMETYLKRYKEMEAIAVTLDWTGIPIAWLSDQLVTADTLFGLEPVLIHGPVGV